MSSITSFLLPSSPRGKLSFIVKLDNEKTEGSLSSDAILVRKPSEEDIMPEPGKGGGVPASLC